MNNKGTTFFTNSESNEAIKYILNSIFVLIFVKSANYE